MILLGLKVTKTHDDKSGKDFVRNRGYFGRKLDSKDGRGIVPSYSADFNSDIDVSALKIGSDYIVETYDYQRTNKETGEIYNFKNVSAICEKK